MALQMLHDYMTERPQYTNATMMSAYLKQIKKYTLSPITIAKLHGVQVWLTRRTRTRNLAEIYKILSEDDQFKRQLEIQAMWALMFPGRPSDPLFWQNMNKLMPRL